MSCFTVGPTEVLITIFDIAFALAFTVAQFRTVNKAAIGDIISDIGKTVNVTDL
jgi:hypothetical protein